LRAGCPISANDRVNGRENARRLFRTEKATSAGIALRSDQKCHGDRVMMMKRAPVERVIFTAKACIMSE
jgi:uncharacterized protein YfiM (DUF2279 family)